MIVNDRYVFKWVLCDRPPQKYQLVAIEGTPHYIHAATGRLFMPNDRYELQWLIGSVFLLTEVELDDTLEESSLLDANTSVTLPIPPGTVVPVSQWAWTKVGKGGAWPRNRCYVCGYPSTGVGAQHAQCNESVEEALRNRTWPVVVNPQQLPVTESL